MRESKPLHLHESSENPQAFTCQDCQVGHLKRKYLTYFTWMGEELITVPDFPAWVCDVCGFREYDMTALNRLTVLLSPTLGRKNLEYGAAARRKPTDHPTPPVSGLE